MQGAVQQEFTFARGRFLVMETKPGYLCVSWYPHHSGDRVYPGFTSDPDHMAGFPVQEALNENWEAVIRWAEQQPWAKPYPPKGHSVAGNPAEPDNCPVCDTYVPSFGAIGIATMGPTVSEPNQQHETCTSCAARLFRTVGEPWRATAPLHPVA